MTSFSIGSGMSPLGILFIAVDRLSVFLLLGIVPPFVPIVEYAFDISVCSFVNLSAIAIN